MAKLYGTLAGDGRAQPKTRCAQTETKAAAQSWEGSLIARVWIDSGGTHHAEIEVAEGSATHGRTLWSGRLAEILGASTLQSDGPRRG